MALTSKSNFKIGSKEFAPQSIKPSFDSLASEDSGRTDDGVMHIEWVKPKLRKYEIQMPPCTSAQAYEILSLVQGKDYNITVWDISTNQEQTIHCYTSNSSADCYSGILHDGFWKGISFSAIELGD